MKYFVAILLTFASFNVYAGLTKWVDSEGVVHYTDGPPPANVKSESVHTSTSSSPAPAASAPAPAAPKTIYEKAADIKKEQKAKDEADQKAAKEKELADAKLKNCEAARSQLQGLQNAPRAVVYNDNGEPSVLDDAARQKKMDEMQDAISKNCN